MKRVWFAVLLIIFVPIAGLAETPAVRSVNPKAIDATPPRYPPEAARGGFSGTSVLVISVSASGQVEDVKLERSAGHPALDAAAMEAARNWKFEPALENGRAVASRVRMPVDFGMGDQKAFQPFLALQTQDDWVPRVPVDEHGHVPGYLHDPLPIEGGSADEAFAILSRRGQQLQVQGLPPDAAIYTVADGKEYSQWWVYTEKGSRTLVRRRLATDGTRGFLMTRMLCATPDSHACFLAQSREQSSPPQQGIVLPTLGGDAKTAGGIRQQQNHR